MCSLLFVVCCLRFAVLINCLLGVARFVFFDVCRVLFVAG